MPIYEYQCQKCEKVFSRLWRSLQAAEENEAPVCPHCGAEHAQRIISQVSVLGGFGGLTPGEQAAKRAQEERLSSITPKDHIDKLRAGKKPKD